MWPFKKKGNRYLIAIGEDIHPYKVITLDGREWLRQDSNKYWTMYSHKKYTVSQLIAKFGLQEETDV